MVSIFYYISCNDIVDKAGSYVTVQDKYTVVTVHKCKECGRTYLSWKEFDTHVNLHLQKHLDEYTPKIPEKKTPWESFSSMNRVREIQARR
jgi:hypothetical protein